MTCAGIGSMVVASRNLTHGDAWILEGRVICCGMQDDDDTIPGDGDGVLAEYGAGSKGLGGG